MGLVYALCAFGIVHGQNDWMNDDPWWEYEDESPIIPIDVRLKLFNLDKAYHQAGDYHNDHFIKEYSRKEPSNAAFAWRWKSFRARWISFSSYLARFNRSVLVNAAYITASRTMVDLDHSQLGGTTNAVLKGLVESAKDLTPYLEDDIVIKKWEIFIGYLKELEDKLKDLQ